jgi:hypothetical protein
MNREETNMRSRPRPLVYLLGAMLLLANGCEIAVDLNPMLADSGISDACTLCSNVPVDADYDAQLADGGSDDSAGDADSSASDAGPVDAAGDATVQVDASGDGGSSGAGHPGKHASPPP